MSTLKGLSLDDFQKICRCCTYERGEIDLFEVYVRDLSLSNLIYTCTREMITKTDGLSGKICNICRESLVNSHNFIRKFQEAQVILRNTYETLKNEQMGTLQDEIPIKKEENYSNLTECKTQLCILSPSDENTEIIEPKKIDNESDDNLIHISVSISSQGKYKKPKRKKLNTRMEVDPNLTSGLDLQCFQCLTVFASKAEMAKHHESTSHTMAPNYKCGICSKAISKRKAYWDHMAMHRHLKKKAVCEVCGAVVVSLHLKRHMLVHQEKTHICQYCGKGYVQKNTLTEHVKRKHEGDEKDLTTLCFICGKLCSDLKGLTTHLNTHAEYKLKSLSHRCDDCGKYFLNSQSLSTHTYMAHKHTERIPKQHKRSKMIRQNTKKISKGRKDITEYPQTEQEKGNEKQTSEKRAPIECPVCKKLICYLGYKRHMTTHSGIKPHQCKYCPKSFRLYTSLKSHTYVHLDIKPFKCDVCGQQFRHYTTLKVHRRVHTGEKPYSCSVCSKGFRSASGLKRHQNQRQHHKPDVEKTKPQDEGGDNESSPST